MKLVSTGENEVLTHRNIQMIFARPGTVDGYKIMKSEGFTPIFDEDEIWCIDKSNVKWLH